METCIIVGAGLSGLTAARTLSEANVRVTILEKEERVGGRMRTDRVGEGVFDCGAQFFTVRSDHFEKMVEAWLSVGIAKVWTHGFADVTGKHREDGHPRYKGTRGMNAIAEHLARSLDVQTDAEASVLRKSERGWEVVTKDATHTADALILTPPYALSLVNESGIPLPDDARHAL